VPRGGRVLIRSPDLSNPIANPAVGFLHFQPQMNTDKHGFWVGRGAPRGRICRIGAHGVARPTFALFLSVSIGIHPWFNSVNA
jgi:hypothetical protein